MVPSSSTSRVVSWCSIARSKAKYFGYIAATSGGNELSIKACVARDISVQMSLIVANDAAASSVAKNSPAASTKSSIRPSGKEVDSGSPQTTNKKESTTDFSNTENLMSSPCNAPHRSYSSSFPISLGRSSVAAVDFFGARGS